MAVEWERVRVGDVAPLVRRPVEAIADKTYREIGIRSFGKGVFHKAPTTGLEIGSKRVFAVEPGDLLFNIVFAWEGAVAVATEAERGMIGSHRFLTCVTDKKRADARYLNYWFRRREGRDQLLWASPGGAGRNRTLGIDKLSALEVPLPPIEEQRRIVARIDVLAAKIAEARGLRVDAEQSTIGVMMAFEREVWPQSSLEGAPSLNDLTTYLSRGRQSEQGESDHFLIKTQHVQMGAYVKTAMRLAEHVASRVRSDAIAQDGDILIACSAAGCLGRVARFSDPGKIASTDTHIAIARANSEKVDPDYLYRYLIGAQGQLQLRSRERGDWQRDKVGFRLTELNVADMRRVPVPLPKRDEQRRIVAELDALQSKVDAVRRLQAETAAELDALLPAILDRAFKGEL